MLVLWVTQLCGTLSTHLCSRLKSMHCQQNFCAWKCNASTQLRQLCRWKQPTPCSKTCFESRSKNEGHKICLFGRLRIHSAMIFTRAPYHPQGNHYVYRREWCAWPEGMSYEFAPHSVSIIYVHVLSFWYPLDLVCLFILICDYVKKNKLRMYLRAL